MSQLVHRCILANFLNSILLDNLSNRLGQEEACRLEPLIRMSVVKLKNFVEGFFRNLAHTLTESPLIEGILNLVALLDLLHVRQDY